MDWKAMLDDFKAQSDALLKQAEAKYEELKKSADSNGDGIPDALETAMAQARQAADAAKARYADLKATLDRDGDGVPDRLEGLSADAKQALDQARARVAELTQAARERVAGTKPGGPGAPAA